MRGWKESVAIINYILRGCNNCEVAMGASGDQGLVMSGMLHYHHGCGIARVGCGMYGWKRFLICVEVHYSGLLAFSAVKVGTRLVAVTWFFF